MDLRRRRQEEEAIRLDEEGNWFHGDYPILHERTIQFLYKNIELDEEGDYFLTGEEKPIYFKIDDVPYWVTKVERTIAGYLITLTDGSIELVDIHKLWINPKKNFLYCAIKGGHVPAKFQRATYYEIAHDIEKDGKDFVIKFHNKKYKIDTAPPSTVIMPGKVKKISTKKIQTKPVKKKASPEQVSVKIKAKKKEVRQKAAKKKPVQKKSASKKQKK